MSNVKVSPITHYRNFDGGGMDLSISREFTTISCYPPEHSGFYQNSKLFQLFG